MGSKFRHRGPNSGHRETQSAQIQDTGSQTQGLGPRDAARPRFRSAATQIQEHRDPYLGHRGPNSLQIGSGLRTQAVNLRTQGPNLRSTQGPRFRPRDVGAQIQKRSDPDSGAQRPRFRSAGAQMQDTGRPRGPNSGHSGPNSGTGAPQIHETRLRMQGVHLRTQRPNPRRTQGLKFRTQWPSTATQIQESSEPDSRHTETRRKSPNSGHRGSNLGTEA